MGLLQAISMYCSDFAENSGVNVDFSSAGMDKLTLDFDAEINLYRLVQEALNNIRKHVGAKHVTVKLVSAFPNIILRIEDNGKGFDVENQLATFPNEKRMGIQSMRERVNMLNGKMRIQSRPMRGTKIFVEIPSKKKKR